MRIENLFSTIPFPYRVQTANPYDLKSHSKGTLFDEPDYHHANDAFWESIDSEGWRTCRAGFAVFTKRLPDESNRFLILHGLKVKPFWTQRGGTLGTSIVLSQEKIESYTSHFVSELVRFARMANQEADQRTKSLATENVHEIRSMNTSLYHAGFELQEQLLYDKQRLPLAKNVVALSELISARIELTDLTTSNLEESGNLLNTPIPVYRKFDKIIKCYIAYAAKREITFSLNGDSRGKTRGIDHFEMIPLIVIDNAVKYSPNKHTIEVKFEEDEKSIFVDIKSLGPKIEPHEMKSIFERETRGENAIKSGQSGSGIGLYFARKLLNTIGAKISVSQDPLPTVLQPRKFYYTAFSLEFEKLV